MRLRFVIVYPLGFTSQAYSWIHLTFSFKIIFFLLLSRKPLRGRVSLLEACITSNLHFTENMWRKKKIGWPSHPALPRHPRFSLTSWDNCFGAKLDTWSPLIESNICGRLKHTQWTILGCSTRTIL